MVVHDNWINVTCAIACVFVACRKSTPPTPAIIETSAPPPVATTAPSAVASATASANAVEDAAPVTEEDSDAQAPWVTAKSTGCLGWNPTTRHAICITGMCGTNVTSTVRALDVLDAETPAIDWLDPKFEGSISGQIIEPPPAASVAKVAKLVAKLHLTPIDEKTARKIGIGQEVMISAAKKLKVRYKRSASGGETTDELELVCNATPKWLPAARAQWPTKDAPTESSADLYVDPGRTMALVVWSNSMQKGLLWAHQDFAVGIDLTAQEDCPL